jgi:hypothetical protein
LRGDKLLVRVDRFWSGASFGQWRPFLAAINHGCRCTDRQTDANNSGKTERGGPIGAQAQYIRHFDIPILCSHAASGR